MLKTFLFILIGIVIGAGILYGVVFGLKIKLPSSTSTAPSSPPPLQATRVSPTVSPTPTPESSKENVDKLKTQLYQEGITISSKVNSVYPGIGFVLSDPTGVKLFTHWTGNSPIVGQTIALKGTIKKVSENIDNLKKEQGYTQTLDNFLKDQSIYIEASSLTNSPQVSPSQ
ncbi:MAG: hypothetical protein A2857_03480 [Candidatus Levybacteria bacterium RIFCSPHIGHO2_01_FULL_36_15]|nr:MAG: hypothetical protein A2857_03480 [Candidatus Levybacteria bacterium RIFCSPHIGHO2_01_FULL_36_15]